MITIIHLSIMFPPSFSPLRSSTLSVMPEYCLAESAGENIEPDFSDIEV